MVRKFMTHTYSSTKAYTIEAKVFMRFHFILNSRTPIFANSRKKLCYNVAIHVDYFGN